MVSQKQLNSLSIMYCNKSILHDVSLVGVANEFVGLQTDRNNVYGRFTYKDIQKCSTHFIIDPSLRKDISDDGTCLICVLTYTFSVHNLRQMGLFQWPQHFATQNCLLIFGPTQKLALQPLKEQNFGFLEEHLKVSKDSFNVVCEV